MTELLAISVPGVSDIISYLVLGTSKGLLYGVMALGIVLIYKGSRVLNFAQPFFGLLTAFVAWWLTARAAFLPFAQLTRPRMVVAVVVALIGIGLYGYASERLVFRRLRGAPRLVNLAATLGVGATTVGLVTYIFEIRLTTDINENRFIPPITAHNFSIGNLGVTGGDIQSFALVPLVTLAAAAFFRYSRFGVAVRAAAENPESASLLGISVPSVSAFIWVAGSVLAGLAGILLSAQAGTVSISILSFGFLVRALAAALIGGLTSLPGAIVGGIVVGIAETTVTGVFNNLQGVPEALLLIVILGILLFRPGGLFGQVEKTEDKVAFVPAAKTLSRSLAEHPLTKALDRISVVTIVVFAIALSMVVGSETNGVLTKVLTFSTVGVSLTMLTGYSGQISLGHWGITGFGAFISAIVTTRVGLPYLVSIPIAVVAGTLVSLVIGLPALRIKGLYLAIATLAFSFAAEFYLFKQEWFSGANAGIAIDPPKIGPFDLDDPSNRPQFLLALIGLVIALVIARNLAGSQVGRTFYALRENEKAAATLGIDLARARLLAFALSGAVASMAGAIMAVTIGSVSFDRFETATSIELVLIVMIGGLGSPAGAIIGAFLIEGIPSLITFGLDWFQLLAPGVLLVVTLIREPGGVVGRLGHLRSSAVETIVALESTSESPSAEVPDPPVAGGPAASPA